MVSKLEQTENTEKKSNDATKQWLVDKVQNMGKELHYLGQKLEGNIVPKSKDGTWAEHDKNHPVLLLTKAVGGLVGFAIGFKGAEAITGGFGPAALAGGIAVGVSWAKAGTNVGLTSLNVFRIAASHVSENISKSMVNWAQNNGAKPMGYTLD